MKKMVKIFMILFLMIIVAMIVIKLFLNNRNISIIDKEKIISKNNTLECTVFDGTEIKGTVTISIEDGKLSNEIIFNQNGSDNNKFFLMPGLIDAHTHISNEKQIEQMINNGVTTTYDVDASEDIANSLGRPDQNITDTTKIRQIWIDGEPVFDAKIENGNIIGNDKSTNVVLPK